MNQENLLPGSVLVLQQTSTKGKIVRVSSATKMVVGDIVLFNPELSVEISLGGTPLQVVKENDILGWYVKIPRFNPE